MAISKISHYRVLRKLGDGAGSMVYEVLDPLSVHHYALKHVVRSNSKTQHFIEQMKTEFEISRRFTHPVLRRSLELEIHKTLLLKPREAVLLMELFEGQTLEQRLPPSLREVIEIFIDVAQGLGAMHEMGLVHCDVKPNNILRDGQAGTKLIDFGQSCPIGTTKPRIQGTPDFIAPEQVNCRPVDVRTDVFNLGATMYWAVTRRHIPTLYTVKQNKGHSFLLGSQIEAPRQLNPRTPPALSNLIMECIDGRPSHRPADMGQVVYRLELAKHAVASEPQPSLHPRPRAAKAPRINLSDTTVLAPSL